MKKYSFLLGILAFVLLVSLAFPKAEAAEILYSGTCGDNLTWTLDSDGTLTISGTGFMEYYSSSSTAPWYSYRSSIKMVIIESGVTSIGAYAFYNCSSLTAITIPDSVTSIGDYAFYYCDSLTAITIPDSVTSIGNYAFRSCSSLTGIWVDVENPNYSSDSYGVLFNKDKSTLIAAPGAISGSYTIPDSVTSIGDYVFYSCDSLTEITIPDSVTSIGYRVFNGCSSLTNVTIGNGVTSIGAYAFYNCSSLTAITIPDSVTSIGDWAFRYCSSLTAITIPDSVTNIGDLAFDGCFSLTGIWVDAENPNYSSDSYGVLFNKDKSTLIAAPGAISGSYTIPDSVTSIGDYAFYSCDSLTEITIPDSVTSIGYRVFNGCSSLTNVTIGNGVTSIGDYAFSSCSGLTSITIPSGVTSIGDHAFQECSSLTAITIPDSVTSIGKAAFYNCSSLTAITIPDSVTSIGDWAFYYCSSLTAITIPDSVTSIGAYAFYNCSSLTAITIPDSVTSIGDLAFYNCSSLTGIWVDAENPNYSSNSYGVLFNKDKSTLIAAPGAISGSYTIPSSVTSIGSYAFYDCNSLTAITIPDSVTSIGDNAFMSCSSLTSVTIGNGVTSIGSYAFYSCGSLTSVTIGNGVTSIGDSAFRYCSSLKHVLYTGTEDQWGGISIGSSNTELINATRHYEASGDEVFWTENCQKSGYYCSICKSYLTEGPAVADAHSYENGVCILCGAGDPDYVEPVEQFELSGANVVLGNDLTMNFALLASNLSGTDYYAEIVKYNPDGTTVTTTYPFSNWTAYGPMYLITLDGLVAKQMSDKVEVTIYTTSGEQASYTWEDSIRDYAIRQLDSNSNSAKVKTCVADMLNYGAAAQVQFNYNTSDLANATMTDAHKSYATASLDFGLYANNQVAGTNFYGTILALETNIKMGVFFRGAGYEGYTAKVSYRDHNGNAVSYEVAGADFDATYAANGMYGIMVDTLVAGDVYQVVTVEVYNGSTLVASVSESMESYVVRQSASLLPIYDALMKFMVSSYNYSH